MPLPNQGALAANGFLVVHLIDGVVSGMVAKSQLLIHEDHCHIVENSSLSYACSRSVTSLTPTLVRSC